MIKDQGATKKVRHILGDWWKNHRKRRLELNQHGTSESIDRGVNSLLHVFLIKSGEYLGLYSQKFRVDRARAFFFGGFSTDHRVYAELFWWHPSLLSGMKEL